MIILESNRRGRRRSTCGICKNENTVKINLTRARKRREKEGWELDKWGQQKKGERA